MWFFFLKEKTILGVSNLEQESLYKWLRSFKKLPRLALAQTPENLESLYLINFTILSWTFINTIKMPPRKRTLTSRDFLELKQNPRKMMLWSIPNFLVCMATHLTMDTIHQAISAGWYQPIISMRPSFWLHAYLETMEL